MKKFNPSSKKEQVIEAWRSGERDIWKMSQDFVTTPSYIASVLQKSGLIKHYYDLFTTPKAPFNVYCDLFKDHVGFRTKAVAQKSVALIGTVYRAFGELQDRAGQHHCMVVALTMYHRALAAGKHPEAEIYRQWLLEHISHREEQSVIETPPARSAPGAKQLPKQELH